MAETDGSFFIFTLLLLLLILMVFAMKYGVQLLRIRSDTVHAAQIASLEEQSRSLEKRVAHIEAVLREVE